MEIAWLPDSLFLHIWRLSWQASVFAVTVLVVQSIFRKHLPPVWRHRLWLLVVFRLVLPFSFETPLSVYNLLRTVPKLEGQGIALDAGRSSPASELLRNRERDIARLAGQADGDRSWQTVATKVWLLGAMLMAALVAGQYFVVRTRVARGEPVRDVKLLDALKTACDRMGFNGDIPVITSNSVSNPALAGLFKPKLLLPVGVLKSLSAEELGAVLLHEIAHLKRRDLLVNWMVTGLQITNWFNPIIWWAFGRLRAEREMACDAAVLSKLDRSQQKSYAQALIRFLEGSTIQPRSLSLVGLLGPSGEIHRRLRAIAEHDGLARGSGTRTAWVLALITATTGLTDAKPVVLRPRDSQRTVEVNGLVVDRASGVAIQQFGVTVRTHFSVPSGNGRGFGTAIGELQGVVTYRKDGTFRFSIPRTAQSCSVEVSAPGHLIQSTDYFSGTNGGKNLTFRLEKSISGQPAPFSTAAGEVSDAP